MLGRFLRRGARLVPEEFLNKQDPLFRYKAKCARQLFQCLRRHVDEGTAKRVTIFLVTHAIVAHRMLKDVVVRTNREGEGAYGFILPWIGGLDPNEAPPRQPQQPEAPQRWSVEPIIGVDQLVLAEESFTPGEIRWLYPFAAMNLLQGKSGWFRRRMGPRQAVLAWVQKREWKQARDRARLLALAESRYGPLDRIPD